MWINKLQWCRTDLVAFACENHPDPLLCHTVHTVFIKSSLSFPIGVECAIVSFEVMARQKNSTPKIRIWYFFVSTNCFLFSLQNDKRCVYTHNMFVCWHHKFICTTKNGFYCLALKYIHISLNNRKCRERDVDKRKYSHRALSVVYELVRWHNIRSWMRWWWQHRIMRRLQIRCAVFTIHDKFNLITDCMRTHRHQNQSKLFTQIHFQSALQNS